MKYVVSLLGLMMVPTCLAHAAAPLGIKVIYPFTAGNDGAQPNGDLVHDDAGNVYGTAAFGGAANDGTVFKLTRAGKLQVLHSFAGGADGENPLGGVAIDSTGNVYGTTTNGGTQGYGEVFEIAANGSFTVLYNFTNGADGANPLEALVLDKAGNLYGIAGGGTSQGGVVFKLSPTGKLTTLHTFSGSVTDGGLPLSSLLLVDGQLYGNTYYGGASGDGTVFKLSLGGKFSLLYSFVDGANDGGFPNHSRLARGADGTLFGVTKNGGSSNSGVLFKLTPDGTETVLHAFPTGSSDGSYPFGGVVLDRSGDIYGTTAEGGSASDGAVFKIAPDGTESIVPFTATSGNFPQGGLAADRGGFVGSTQYGGTNRFGGVIFKISN